MTGKAKSQREVLAEYEKILDDYKDKLGISALPKASSIEDYLSLSIIQLRKITAEECGEIAFMLNQYAAWLQTQANRQNSRLLWAEDRLNKLIVTNAESVGYDKYMKYEILKYRIITSNEAGKVLNQIKIESSAVKSELDNLVNRVTAMAGDLRSLQIGKSKRG